MNDVYDDIIRFTTERNFKMLLEIKKTLVEEIKHIDEFLENFLKYNKLDRRKKTVDNWVLYKNKTEKYCEIKGNLNIVNYYLEKFNV